MKIPYSNWGPFLFLFPQSYINPQRTTDIVLPRWSVDDYTYNSDEGWWLFGDWIQTPNDTIERGTGDCEDYAIIAASWAIENNVGNPRLAWLWEGWWPPYPKHVVAYTDDIVFTSGDILDNTTIDEYVEQTDYTHYVSRSLQQ